MQLDRRLRCRDHDTAADLGQTEVPESQFQPAIFGHRQDDIIKRRRQALQALVNTLFDGRSQKVDQNRTLLEPEVSNARSQHRQDCDWHGDRGHQSHTNPSPDWRCRPLLTRRPRKLAYSASLMRML